MLNYDISNLSFTQIRIFLCAAESPSFSVAAKKLNFTQSMISKTIAALERDLGLPLFYREKNQTILTPAGKTLYSEWKNLSSFVEQSVEKAYLAQQNVEINLSIVTPDTGIVCTQAVKAVQEFQERYPSANIQYTEYPLDQIMDLAQKKQVDILVTTGYEMQTLKNLGYLCKPFIRSHLAIYVHRSNPLFQRDSITVSDLKTEPFIVLSPARNPNYIQLLNRVCSDHGFQPQISVRIPNAHSFEVNLLTGRGIVFADTDVNIRHPDIKMFPLPADIAPDYCGTLIAWQHYNPYAQIFVDLAIKSTLEETEYSHSNQLL